MEAIVHGIILAFALILPLGVQNVFVFSQGATQPKLILAGTVMKKIDGTEGLMNIFNKCSALFIWGTAIYLFIGLI